MSDAKRMKFYLPPSEHEIRDFVWQVCHHLAETTVDKDFAHPAVVSGLSEFLRFVAELECKRLNTAELLDSDQLQS